MQCIAMYAIHLKSVLSYKFLILDNLHLDGQCLHEQGCDEAKRGLQAKKYGKCWSNVVYGKCIILEFSWHEWRKSRKTTPNNACLTGISNPLFGIEKIRANLHVHFLQPCFGCQQSQVCAVWVLDTPKLCLQHLLLFGTESHNTDIGVLWGQLGRHRLQHLRTNQKYCISYLKLLTYNFRRIRKTAKSAY